MNNRHKIGWLMILQQGRRYMKSWPQEKRLAVIFPENRISLATAFGIRYMPPLAAFILCWQISFHAQLGPSIATALFAASLPLQGLYWLGKRAMQPLPPTILNWFHTIREKLLDTGQAIALPEGQVTYQNLAELLKRAFKQLDRTFLDEL